MHRLYQNAIWHFYYGSPLTLYTISPDGNLEKIILGHDIENNQQLTFIVPQKYWRGAICHYPHSYSLVGFTAAPSFNLDDCEEGERASLTCQFPHAAEIISLLTRK